MDRKDRTITIFVDQHIETSLKELVKLRINFKVDNGILSTDLENGRAIMMDILLDGPGWESLEYIAGIDITDQDMDLDNETFEVVDYEFVEGEVDSSGRVGLIFKFELDVYKNNEHTPARIAY